VTAPKPEPEPEPEPAARAPTKGAKRGAGEDAASGEMLFSVFLNRISSKEKQEQAAKLLATVRGCSIAEAREQVKKIIVPVVRDVNKEDADNCLKKFTEIGITGKTTRKK
jgi:ribosomal protein L7/L12